MLQLDNITKIWGEGTVDERRALNHLSLYLEPGDFVTIIGGNGSGKSTLLNTIAGVFPPDEGLIFLDGEDITALPEHKRAAHLGRVFQDPMLGSAADMTIEENLALAARRNTKRNLRWGIKKQERDEFKELLAQLDLGLEDRLTAKVGLLSGGQRQALTLLMAAMAHPKLLLLDEHTAALDPKTAAKVLEITNHIVQKNHLTTLMVTHSMQDAARYGNKLIMMHEGNIVYQVAGEEKDRITIPQLLEKFQRDALPSLGAELFC